VAFAGAAQAEGLYTYALIDGGIASTRISGPSATNYPSPISKTEFVTGGYAPTFAGMTYEKGLSGGYTVGGKIEQGFLLSADNNGHNYGFGNGDILNREANIYLKSGTGTFVVGRQPNTAFKTVLLGDPRSGSNYGSSLSIIDITQGLSTVDDAALTFVSAPMSGFTGTVEWVPESKSAATGNLKSGSRASLHYGGGNLNAGVAVYTDTKYTSATATSNATGSIASAAYKLSDLTLKGIYASQKTASTASSVNTQGFGGAYAVNADTTIDAGIYSSSGGGLKLNTTAVGVQYKLNKELTLYAQYADVQNKGSVTAASNFTWYTVLTDSLAASQAAKTLNVGLLLALF
jgi:hypothetical protein